MLQQANSPLKTACLKKNVMTDGNDRIIRKRMECELILLTDGCGTIFVNGRTCVDFFCGSIGVLNYFMKNGIEKDFIKDGMPKRFYNGWKVEWMECNIFYIGRIFVDCFTGLLCTGMSF
jgi:hypothetical protein